MLSMQLCISDPRRHFLKKPEEKGKVLFSEKEVAVNLTKFCYSNNPLHCLELFGTT